MKKLILATGLALAPIEAGAKSGNELLSDCQDYSFCVGYLFACCSMYRLVMRAEPALVLIKSCIPTGIRILAIVIKPQAVQRLANVGNLTLIKLSVILEGREPS